MAQAEAPAAQAEAPAQAQAPAAHAPAAQAPAAQAPAAQAPAAQAEAPAAQAEAPAAPAEAHASTPAPPPPASNTSSSVKLGSAAALGLLGLGTVAFLQQKHKHPKRLLGGLIPDTIQSIISSVILLLKNETKTIYLFKSSTCFNHQEKLFVEIATKHNMYASGFFEPSFPGPQLFAPLNDACFNNNTLTLDEQPSQSEEQVSSGWFTLEDCYRQLWYNGNQNRMKKSLFYYNWAQMFSKIFHVKYCVVFVHEQPSGMKLFSPSRQITQIELYTNGIAENRSNELPDQVDLLHVIEQNTRYANQFRPLFQLKYPCTADQVRRTVTSMLSSKYKMTNISGKTYHDGLNPSKRFWVRGGQSPTLQLAISLAKHDVEKPIQQQSDNAS